MSIFVAVTRDIIMSSTVENQEISLDSKSDGFINSVHISKNADDFNCSVGSRGDHQHQVFIRNIREIFTSESYSGGSLVKIKRDNTDWERTTHIDRSEISKRGRITGFSQASRRRMLQVLSKLNKSKISDDKILFVTLTAGGKDSGWESVSGEQWKKRLNNFLTQLRQKHLGKMQFGMWRKEYQKRSSIDGVRAIHFHIVLWNVRYLDKDWVAKCWNRICCKGLDADVAEKHLKAGTQVEKARGWGKTQEYFSKTMAYLAKDGKSNDAVESVNQFGRHWGYIAKSEMMSFVESVVEKLDYEKYYACRRMILNYLRASRRRQWGSRFDKKSWRFLKSHLLTSDKKNYTVFLEDQHWRKYLKFLLKKSNTESVHFKINRNYRQFVRGELVNVSVV